MKQKSFQANHNLAAAILFGLLALSCLQTVSFWFERLSGGAPVLPDFVMAVLPLAAYAFAAVVFFRRERGQLALLAVRLLAVLALLVLIYNHIKGYYNLEIYHYKEDNEIRFSLLCLFPFLLRFAAWLGLALQSEHALAGRFARYGRRIGTLWFLPGILYAASFPGALPASMTGDWNYSSLILSPSGLLSALLFAAALIFASMWVVWPDGLPNSGEDAAVSTGDGYCGIIKFLLLSVFTLGIWYLIWVFRTTRYLNRVEGELRQRPGGQLLACMFVPFYGAFWTYKNARRLDRLSASYGLEDKLAVLCLALSALPLGLLAGAIMQDRINTIALINAGTVTPPAPARSAAPAAGAPIPVEANPDQLPEL